MVKTTNRFFGLLLCWVFFVPFGTMAQTEAPFLIFGQPNIANQSKSYVFQGNVKEVASKKNQQGVNLVFPDLKKGVVTDEDGNFTIELPYGIHTLQFEALGLESPSIKIGLYASVKHNFYLQEKAEELDEVVLLNRQNDNIESEMIGKSSLMADESKNIPLVLGEQNLLKAATILPGISSAGEAANGFNVRGGKADQNLMLLDQAVVINPNHFFGIFQALNPFAIQSLNVYKGNIPIEYEGRTSSVFEINTKKPNVEEFTGELSLGPITANALLELPIKKNKSGVMLGVRSAHSDWVLKQLKDPKLKKSSASFYDVILTHENKLDENNQLKSTLYLSNDQFSITSDSLYQYSNQMATVIWVHKINEKNNLKVVASHSGYAFSILYDGGISNNFKSEFDLSVQALKVRFNSEVNKKHMLTYGANLSNYTITPGKINPLSSTDLIRPTQIADERALEGSLFIADRISFSERFVLNIGLQMALYGAFGPYNERTYQADLPKSDLSVISTNAIPSGSLFAQRFFPTYRISGRYKLSDAVSIKFAGLKIYQFLHSLTNNTTASPIDTWRISTHHLKPQESHQLSLGFFANLNSAAIELSLEGFYKNQANLVDFKTGAQLFLNEFIETEVLQGKGKAYGVEFLLRKKAGKHTGWLGYTFARSLIQLESVFSIEEVNNGAFFPTNYDKPHDLSFTWNYALYNRINFSSNVLYQTGRPITLPSGNYIFNDAEYVLFSNRNAYRIPNYYRVDVALNYARKKRQNRKYGLSWSLSVYNILGRNNPFSVYFISENGSIEGKQSSIFNVPIPSMNINISF